MSSEASSSRNAGIDLLRLLCMYMVAVLHVCGQGGAMVRIASQPAAYYACWFLETCATCAVNCYGLISGYVGIKSTFRPWKLLLLYLQVWFWSVLLFLVFALPHPGWITVSIVQKSFLPVSFKSYWYFSGYVVLFLMMPFLNKGIQAMSSRMQRSLALALIAVFSVATMLPKIFSSDFLSLAGGYTFLWLMVLYVIGACLRESGFRAPSGIKLSALYIGMVLLAWIYKILMENTTRKVLGEAKYGKLFITYTSLPMLLCALCLLFLFARIRMGRWMTKVVEICSPAAFGVYIIHAHPMIWENILKKRFSHICYLGPIRAAGAVLGSALLLFIVCLLLELLRIRLFTALHVSSFCQRFARKLEDQWDRLIDRTL